MLRKMIVVLVCGFSLLTGVAPAAASQAMAPDVSLQSPGAAGFHTLSVVDDQSGSVIDRGTLNGSNCRGG